MTVKSRRAEALRKMSYQEASSYILGGIVDETFPVDDVHAALKTVLDSIDVPDFDEFFGRALGRYRSMSESKQEQPNIADELSLIGESMEYVQQIRLRLEHLPPVTDAHVNTVCWKRRKELFHDFRLRLDADLKEAWVLLALAERELETLKGAPGRKSESLRDWLLHDVAHRLEITGIGKEASAGMAAAVLRAAGVAAPEDPREARKLVLAVEKLRGENCR